jgi:methylated-DNA-[protein]-cysteine S-methyltransferase
MTPKSSVCRDIERDLVAAATGEAEAAVDRRVQQHVARCERCRDEFGQYRAVERAVTTLRTSGHADASADAARLRLVARLADLRTRLVTYGVFPSPLGPILIGRSEHGVSLIEYLDRGGVAGSRLARESGLEVEENAGDLERLYRELLDYLEGRRTHLSWPLDLRLARSDFHREVLRATAAVPYGSVTSYLGIAGAIGQPSAVRAVAQALRHNPIPIVVPCHRIIGAGGDLTGYAGSRLELKEQLLAVEGVRTERVSEVSRIARQALYHYEANDAHEYCVPSCGSIARRPIGRVTLIASRERAGALGLVPCATCRPDLHPLPGA